MTQEAGADILKLSEYRIDEVWADEIDLVTAVDAAIRDLQEVLICWGSEGEQRLTADRKFMLRGAYSESWKAPERDARTQASDASFFANRL